MRKLIAGAAAVAAALVMPATAQATHVPGATYTGTFSTGAGGTATLVVSEDGSSVSWYGQNWGRTTPTNCVLNFGPQDMPIVNHAFNYSANAGQVTVSGAFGQPGDVAGSAQILNTPCTTGSQAWSATTLVPGVDSLIARSTDPAPLGDGVFNTTAAGQTRNWSAKRGQTRAFPLEFQNDGNDTGQIDVDGCGNSRGFKVTYLIGAMNVTSQVAGGTFTSGDLAPSGGSFEMVMKIKATKKAKVGKTKACRVVGSSSNDDAVKAELKVKRG